MEANGIKKENFLLATILPLNNAIAICGAKPQGLLGITLYKEAISTSKTKLHAIDLSIFIFLNLCHKNRQLHFRSNF